jgi:4-amino-4-deoxy-L-arabinose transferase-like glycosyltransferase
MRTSDRAFTLRLFAIAAGALLLRVLYVTVLDPHQKGYGDFYYFHDVANAIADGYGHVDPGSLLAGHPVATAAHPPLWPELLSLVSRLGGSGAPIGTKGPNGFIAHRLTGGLVGTGTVVVIGYLARRVAGPRVGLVAAAIAAVYPVLIAADGSLMSESLFGLVVAIGMVLAYRLRDEPQAWLAVALGVVIGLASLVRSEGLILIALLAVPVVWNRRIPLHTVLSRLALVCVGVTLAIGPWTIRNSVRVHALVLGSTQQGALLAGANNHRTYYTDHIGWWDYFSLGPPGPGNEAQVSDRMRRKGTEYALAHAGRLPVVAAVRVLRTWDLYQPRSAMAINEGRDVTVSRIGLVFYWLLLPLAVLGAVALRVRHTPLRVLVAPVWLVTIVSAVGWGTTRFRHPAEISVVIFAAIGLTEGLDRVRRLIRPT